MGHRLEQGSDERFAAYVEEIASVIGHADRVGPLAGYCIGLLLPSERKSVEPMAAVTAPERVSARSAPRRGVDGCWLWRQHRTALEHHGARFDIRCRHFAEYNSVGRGRRAVAAKAIVRPRATSKTDAQGRQASTDLSQGALPQPARKRLAQGHLARRCSSAALLTICTHARARGTSRLQAHRTLPGRMAAR